MAAALLFAISIALRADPPRVVLGERNRVELEIRAPGAPADARLEIWTSVGRVSEVRRESADRFRAAWFRPRERFPQVALLLATVRANGAEDRAWLALPLISSEKLPFHTKPNSSVTLAIGDALFGPVRADGSGRTRVAVNVPPGQRTARVRVRDPFGNVKETSVDLRPPPFQRLKLVPLGDRASWADAGPLRFEIFAVAADGQPAKAAALSSSVDRGQLHPIVEKGPGVFELSYRAPEKAGGVATIRVGIAGDPRKESAAIAILPGPPSQIRLSATPGVVAGAGEARVAAELLDARDNALPSQAIEFSSDFATVEPDGSSARLRVPAAHDGRRQVRMTAKAGVVSGSLIVPLKPGPPARASIRFSPDTARKSETIEALVAVRDAGGKPVSDAVLEIAAEDARTNPPRLLEDGLYAISMQVDRGSGTRSAQLRVRCGTVDERARIEVARSDMADGIAVGTLLGGQSNLSRANAASLQAEVATHVWLPALEVLARTGLLQFASASESVSGVTQRGELRGLSLALGVRASAPLGNRFSVHAAVLAGALRTFGTVTVENGPASGIRQGTAQWGPLGSASVGASMQAGRGRAVAELQLAW